MTDLDDALIQPWCGTAEALVEATSGQDFVRWLRGSRMRTRQGLMDEWAAATQFPPHFGATWDALRDALADLPEGGTFLVLEAEQLLREAPPEDLATLMAVLQQARADLAPKALRLILQAEPQHFVTLQEGLRNLG